MSIIVRPGASAPFRPIRAQFELTCTDAGVAFLAWRVADATGNPRGAFTLAQLSPEGVARITAIAFESTDQLQVAEVPALVPVTAA